MREISLSPAGISKELDQNIVGQKSAKKLVSIALRNRWRRQQLPPEIKSEITPKNILMIGPTGVGKTEIARRLAKLINAPFIKVEASKYTEVGYVGRDVESMIRDLVDVSFNIVRKLKFNEMQNKAKESAYQVILNKLVPANNPDTSSPLPDISAADNKQPTPETPNLDATRKRYYKNLTSGALDEKSIELEITQNSSKSMFEVIPIMGNEGIDQLRNMMSQMMPSSKKKSQVKIKDALKILTAEEAEKLIDLENVKTEALKRAEELGIVFIDEFDKIAKSHTQDTSSISKEGVQRDLLPIIEGSVVNTKYGIVNTDHILFIAAGAFHAAKPSDLIPEIQGRFPIRVELDALTKEDLYLILKEPRHSLIFQYQELLKVEGVKLVFRNIALTEIANIAFELNLNHENIGARRLQALMEKILEEISFAAGENKGKTIVINAKFVKDRLQNILKKQDLARYIL
ncbi:MAG: ATP-dependent protease ATPase subunit HslU [SAR324 cluster bacterium]|nr:ATP-dependent protease ATPase subunit HslU [SAR324 cluster bacterium]